MVEEKKIIKIKEMCKLNYILVVVVVVAVVVVVVEGE